ncbi:major capsid protein [Nocardia vaccinii]|uniref:major capsid protein n=1 Tax=Nocardia vaccinii TaxID=1822 RepID=UPI00082F550E|nr:major capsid protein [Nocardia vaccinii]
MTAPNPSYYPLGPASVSGSQITLDVLLNEPTRITAYLADLSLQNFFADRIFTNGGGVSGGSVIYNQITYNDLYPTRDVATVAPGSEFPNLTSSRPTPLVAVPEKFGGKFGVTDEEKRRNDPWVIQSQGVKVMNAITRKINTRAMTALASAVAQTGGATTMVGNNWASTVTGGSSQTTNQQWPSADFAKAQMLADETELGYSYDTWIVNPQEAAHFREVYSGNGAAQEQLDSYGITMFSTNRCAAGTAYAVATGRVGQMRMEVPLSTESWRDPEEQVTWVQSFCAPAFAVTEPYAVVKVTGLAG